jgi:hypothetical protein
MKIFLWVAMAKCLSLLWCRSGTRNLTFCATRMRCTLISKTSLQHT